MLVFDERHSSVAERNFRKGKQNTFTQCFMILISCLTMLFQEMIWKNDLILSIDKGRDGSYIIIF
jgi:hypothetical protein